MTETGGFHRLDFVRGNEGGIRGREGKEERGGRRGEGGEKREEKGERSGEGRLKDVPVANSLSHRKFNHSVSVKSHKTWLGFPANYCKKKQSHDPSPPIANRGDDLNFQILGSHFISHPLLPPRLLAAPRAIGLLTPSHTWPREREELCSQNLRKHLADPEREGRAEQSRVCVHFLLTCQHQKRTAAPLAIH